MTPEQKRAMKDKGWIIERRGGRNQPPKEFITWPGLIWYVNQIGTLLKLEVDMVEIDWSKGRFVAKATAVLKNHNGDLLERTSYGDCTPHNVSDMILPSALRMAGTRAKARALRDLCGIGMTAAEEIP
jgi:hypothetical protein